jgi:hypothetical protein
VSTRRGDDSPVSSAVGARVDLCYSSSVAVSPTFWASVSLMLASVLGAPTVVFAMSSAGDAPVLAAGPDTAVTPARSPDRRRTFVMVVGFAALAFGLTGLYLVRRKKQHTIQAADPTPEPAEAGTPASKAPPSSAPMAMICPTCLEQYSADARFCKLDGNRLITLREGTDPRGPTGGVCPICSQGFDPGVIVCPQHQEDLVPAPIHLAQRTSGSYPKICPTCGVQYPIGSGFCGADGSALVTVN